VAVEKFKFTLLLVVEKKRIGCRIISNLGGLHRAESHICPNKKNYLDAIKNNFKMYKRIDQIKD
jgi:hypothetical protein